MTDNQLSSSQIEIVGEEATDDMSEVTETTASSSLESITSESKETDTSLSDLNDDRNHESIIEQTTETTELVTKLSSKRALYAATLPNDPNIIAIDKVFQPPIGVGPNILNDGKLLQINPDKKNQYGAIWSRKQISLLSDFTFKSYLYLGDNKSLAADGMTFTLTNDPRMTSSPSQVIGSSGKGLGAYSENVGQSYIRNALSIEFDTYYNGDWMDSEIGRNSDYGHVGFVTPKYYNGSYRGEHSGVIKPNTHLSNGNWRLLTVKWNAVNQQLSYELEGIGTASYTVQDINKQFGGSSVYWGFTSSTGERSQENALAITQIPSEVSSKATMSIDQGNYVTEGEAEHLANIKFKNILNVTNYFMVDVEKRVTIDLPSELAYVDGSVKLNGQSIQSSELIVENNRLMIDVDRLLVAKEDLTIEFEASVVAQMTDKLLTLNFQYLEDEVLIKKSNDIALHIIKPKEKTLNVYYKNFFNQSQDVAEPKKITGKIGASYQEQPKNLPGYVFKSDSGNTAGIFEHESKDIYFYYRVGELYLAEVPEAIQFGQHKISNTDLRIYGQAKGRLAVVDERASSGWRLQLSESQPLNNNGHELMGVLSFVNDSSSRLISDQKITVFESDDKGQTDLTSILENKDHKGIRADIPVEEQRLGAYEGRLLWSLENVPAN
ncbi:lectin [Vagococcus zengguangii]|uniref:Lectin n=2 Tax=Vagococcus zengguangii TaxID=2571750 RepID=A0A4D7CT34_9ENTE|nr:lectin [Vagococcus zengguangii]TLG80096.1 lectin [Vagococcus zengguangii]